MIGCQARPRTQTPCGHAYFPVWLPAAGRDSPSACSRFYGTLIPGATGQGYGRASRLRSLSGRWPLILHSERLGSKSVVIFAVYCSGDRDLRAVLRAPGVLTFRPDLLSKPCRPLVCKSKDSVFYVMFQPVITYHSVKKIYTATFTSPWQSAQLQANKAITHISNKPHPIFIPI